MVCEKRVYTVKVVYAIKIQGVPPIPNFRMLSQSPSPENAMAREKGRGFAKVFRPK
jgi:hypothetical protein